MEKYSRNNQIINGALEDNLVMMNVEKGKYFGLNPVGKRIWELIGQPVSVNEIVTSLQAEFEVSPEQCLAEVQEFLLKMEKSDLIKKTED